MKLIQLLGQVRRPQSLPVLMGLFHNAKSDAIRGAALTAAQSFGDPKVLQDLLAEFPKLKGSLRQQALGILLSRPNTTLTVLHQVDAKKLDPKSIPVEQLRPLLDFKNPQIDKLVIKHWGKIGHATPGEKMARIAWLNTELGRGKGYAASGKILFTKNCAVCHTLFGEGAKIGPDLTTADRKNRRLPADAHRRSIALHSPRVHVVQRDHARRPAALGPGHRRDRRERHAQ